MKKELSSYGITSMLNEKININKKMLFENLLYSVDGPPMFSRDGYSCMPGKCAPPPALASPGRQALYCTSKDF